MDLFGKDFIVSQDWSLAELKELLDLAAKMKLLAALDEHPAAPHLLYVLLQPLGAHAAEL
jgi:ornithine carbamoyltransferase